jgi:N-acetylmuramoyl-L-alanine amidase
MKVYYLSRRCLWLVLLPVLVCVHVVFSDMAEDKSLAGKIIVVDAGHGGVDSGANRPGVREKDINLAIALQVRDGLQGSNAKVMLTRDTDVELSGSCDNEKVRGRYRRDLNARLELIQESDADLFVSIHANASSNPRQRGVECYYYSKSEAGKTLALLIQEQLRTVAPISQEAERANFFVLRRNHVPAVLIETGFITNPNERVLLQSPEYQRKIAEAIVSGIVKYYQTSAKSADFSLQESMWFGEKFLGITFADWSIL